MADCGIPCGVCTDFYLSYSRSLTYNRNNLCKPIPDNVQVFWCIAVLHIARGNIQLQEFCIEITISIVPETTLTVKEGA